MRAAMRATCSSRISSSCGRCSARGHRNVAFDSSFADPAPRRTAQQVRQAYDEFARPSRLIGALAIAPGLFALARRGGIISLAVAAAGVVAAAEVGRRRKGGTRVFSPVASLLAPAWVLERAVCSWLALGQKVHRGGVVYGDMVIARAANSSRELRRREAVRTTSGPPRPAGSLRRHHQRAS